MNLIKKIIVLIFSFFMFFWISHSYEKEITVKIFDKNEMILEKKVIWVWIEEWKTYLTNELWEIKFKYDFDILNNSNNDTLTMKINWNYIYLKWISSELNLITIYYDKELEKIIKVNWIDWTINNQEIKKITNYYVLILFIFFTIFIFTILVGSTFVYIKLLWKDVINFQNNLKK